MELQEAFDAGFAEVKKYIDAEFKSVRQILQTGMEAIQQPRDGLDGKDGAPGAPGEIGPQGKDGPPGNDAEIPEAPEDVAVLVSRAIALVDQPIIPPAQMSSAPVIINQSASETQPRTKRIVTRRDADGNLVADVTEI